MQPVVELSRLDSGLFAYAIRAPRSRGQIPPHSYRESGFSSLPICLADVAKGLMPRFNRVWIRYQTLCVGERDLIELRIDSARAADELLAEYGRVSARQEATKEATSKRFG